MSSTYENATLLANRERERRATAPATPITKPSIVAAMDSPTVNTAAWTKTSHRDKVPEKSK